MTDIFEYKKKQKIAMEKGEKSGAEQLFLDNIGHIETISTTQGYKMIRNWWVTEGNSALDELSKIDINNVKEISLVKAKLDLSIKFINYLNSHEKGLT